MTKTIKQKKGFTLLLSLLVSSAVLLGSYAISNVLFYQLKQVSNNKESIKAFVSADNGIECAIFYDEQDSDEKYAFVPTDYPNLETPRDEAVINCASTSNATNGDSMISSQETVSLNQGEGTQNIFEIIYGDDDNSPCARVTVKKTLNNDGGIETVIESRGYNRCNPELPRRIERAVRVRY